MNLMILFRWLAARAIPLILLSTSPSPLYSQQTPKPRPIGIADLFTIRDLHDPQITPDGKWVAYSVGSVNRRNFDGLYYWPDETV
jgi:hypothetical protein